MQSYKTLLKLGKAELIEKKSRFIASAAPISSEEEAQRFIEAIKKEYWDARHNCFAYCVDGIKRCSDNGEPSGTAGRPMLDVLEGRGLDNVIVVVTRYFGGILLGTGGLVSMYGRTAKEGVAAAGVVDMMPYTAVNVVTDYGAYGKLQYELQAQGYIIKDIVYTDSVELQVLIPFDECRRFIKFAADLTAGQAKITENENLYVKCLDGKPRIDLL